MNADHCSFQGAKVKLISSYTDRSGLFTSDLSDEDDSSGHADMSAQAEQPEANVAARSEAEEEDELLYGDIDDLIKKEK